MEEALTRQDYPAMLARLLPKQALSDVTDRQTLFEKLNHEVAEWLMERRKIETSYATSLAKLARKPMKGIDEAELGLFLPAWKHLIAEVDETAHNHYTFTQKIEREVEAPLRKFVDQAPESREFQSQRSNMASLATAVTTAQRESDKLAQKGGKANAAKVEAATLKLQNASSQWDSQAPFIMETFQVLDEARLNHLREVLTQYQTHELAVLTDCKRSIERSMNALLEVDTAQEIKNWSKSVTAGKPITERRARQLSAAPTDSSVNSPPPPSSHGDNASSPSNSQEHFRESKTKSRIGTILNRRRQSIHGGFARAPSPTKMPPFLRSSTSRDGRPSPSPRASTNNLQDASRDARLSSLAESPPSLSPPGQTNGTYRAASFDRAAGSPVKRGTNGSTPGSDLFDFQPPPGPPPSQMQASPPRRTDSDGFTVPTAMNDPISQAQMEAGQEGELPQFKLDIRKDPIPEQDADAQAALSNVTNTLRSSVAIAPTRKVGTVRGRRDVRNTVYNPTALDIPTTENQLPPSPSPPAPIATSRAAALAALSSPDPASDTTSIRSGNSLANNVVVKHVDSHLPGINASIIETASATFSEGQIRTAKIGGEIALNYNSESVSPVTGTETLRINNFPNLEAIGPNRTFIHPVCAEKPDEFTIDLSSLTSRSSVAFTYRVHVPDENISAQAPLHLKPAWKHQGDKLGLVIEYCLNPSYSTSPITFNNLVLVAIYTSAKASTCQTKPSGTHLKEKSLVYWRLGDLSLSSDWHKVICRFGGIEGAIPIEGHVEARWEIHDSTRSGISISKLESAKGKERERDALDIDPFADESLTPTNTGPRPDSKAGTWREIGLSRKFVSGKYEAMS